MRPKYPLAGGGRGLVRGSCRNGPSGPFRESGGWFLCAWGTHSLGRRTSGERCPSGGPRGPSLRGRAFSLGAAPGLAGAPRPGGSLRPGRRCRRALGGPAAAAPGAGARGTRPFRPFPLGPLPPSGTPLGPRGPGGRRLGEREGEGERTSRGVWPGPPPEGPLGSLRLHFGVSCAFIRSFTPSTYHATHAAHPADVDGAVPCRLHDGGRAGLPGAPHAPPRTWPPGSPPCPRGGGYGITGVHGVFAREAREALSLGARGARWARSKGGGGPRPSRPGVRRLGPLGQGPRGAGVRDEAGPRALGPSGAQGPKGGAAPRGPWGYWAWAPGPEGA